MKITAIPLLIVPAMLVAGCTSSFTKVREAVNSAPEWYGERRAEIRGEGYPDLAALPQSDPKNDPGDRLRAQLDRSDALDQAFADARAEVAAGGAEEILAIAENIRGNFDAMPPEADFLTDAEITAIRNKFNVPRVTRDEF
ncbi:hypothetical protein K1X12_13815 [Hyphomonas sp. WL0036]|uniref:hypothetical protein n=1 Tax=Hyphomonas sediminis TaxID=2866160 RepID=UPI001C823E55|nr:hypothetical protein [Hyphomonas sediminis]MBY9067983.1 hypothetical protein [Hyphomonas sediminis]